MGIFKRESGIKTKAQREKEEASSAAHRKQRDEYLARVDRYMSAQQRPDYIPGTEPVPKRKFLPDFESYEKAEIAAHAAVRNKNPSVQRQQEMDIQRQYRGKPIPKKSTREIDVEKEATNRVRRKK